jgi:FixJ family two-component response regulator
VNETPLGDLQVGTTDRLVDIVDDDPSFRRALIRLLKSVGLRSVGYSSAGAYLEAADQASSLCLLLDIHLPGMSGIELLEHLREVAPDLPVICMTGRDEPETKQRLAAAGVSTCLRKPFDEAELFKALSRVARVSISGETP